MDPNAALEMVRTLGAMAGRGKPNGFSGTDAEYAEQLATELAGQFSALDEWLGNGGFLPDAWLANRFQPVSMAAIRSARKRTASA
jgi:hypothetical protein